MGTLGLVRKPGLNPVPTHREQTARKAATDIERVYFKLSSDLLVPWLRLQLYVYTVPVEVIRCDGAVNHQAVVAIISEDITVPIGSRPACVRVLRPRSEISSSSLMGFTVSGRNVIGPRGLGSPSGS